MAATGKSRTKRRSPAPIAQRRPPAPRLEWSFWFVCVDCRATSSVVTFKDKKEMQVRHPGRCGICGGGRLSLSRRAKVLDDYAGAITGMHMRMRLDPRAAPVLDVRWTEEVYRATGELHRYERVFDRENDVYFKRYTNLVTGKVVVEEREPLSKHVGRGAARRSAPAPALAQSSSATPSDISLDGGNHGEAPR